MKQILYLMFLVGSLVSLTSCTQEGKHEHNHSASASAEKSMQAIYYTCPMHPSIHEKSPGKCPICGMNLTKVEVASETLVKHTKRLEGKVSQQLQNLEAKSYYTCPMHPTIHEEEPGECPICGMNLTKVISEQEDTHRHKEGGTASIPLDSTIVAKVHLRKAQQHHFKPDYFQVRTMKMQKSIRLLGSVSASEERKSTIPARIAGRVEKVYVKSTGSKVKVGDKVLDIYSPTLITAGEEYLLAKQSAKQSKATELEGMLKQSIEKLALWGIRPFQYQQWYKRGAVPRVISLYSNVRGIVQKRNATEGKYFKEGENFFELADLHEVWVEMDVYEHEASLVKEGQKVTLEFSALPGEILEGEIDFIDPVLDSTTRTLKVRTTIQNSKSRLKPGMVADAILDVEIEGMPLVVPTTAIIDTGVRKVVWVKVDEMNFQAKEVTTGYSSKGYVAITSGLHKGDAVVIEGNFLLDAQAQLFGGYELMK